MHLTPATLVIRLCVCTTATHQVARVQSGQCAARALRQAAHGLLICVLAFRPNAGGRAR